MGIRVKRLRIQSAGVHLEPSSIFFFFTFFTCTIHFLYCVIIKLSRHFSDVYYKDWVLSYCYPLTTAENISFSSHSLQNIYDNISPMVCNRSGSENAFTINLYYEPLVKILHYIKAE